MRGGVLAAALAALVGAGSGAAREPDEQDFTQIERGRYLAILGDCAACHTVPGSGKAFAGGRPIETPFGTLLSPNITPDAETGIGAWSEAEFVNSLRKGTGRNGTAIYPAMPYVYMTKLTTQDALAIRAYLNTIEPVRNAVTSNQLPFPFNIRAGLRIWDALYFREGVFQPVADKSAEWNRGAYLVEGAGHCGLCHTPKTALGGDDSSRALQGYALQGWFAPNITNDARRGLGGWSIEQIVAYLKTGHNESAGAAGPMAEEVSLSSSGMTMEDLRAIAIFLKDQPGQSDGGGTPLVASDRFMTAGAAIYTDECAACHKMDGTGVPGLIPALKGSPSAQSIDPISLIRVVLRGAQTVATDEAPTGPAMPSFAWQLDDDQVAAVTTYARNAWGNAAPAVSPQDVKSARALLAGRSD